MKELILKRSKEVGLATALVWAMCVLVYVSHPEGGVSWKFLFGFPVLMAALAGAFELSRWCWRKMPKSV